MFTFVCGTFFAKEKFNLVIIYVGKIKFKKKERKEFKNLNLNYVYHDQYFTTIRKDNFEEYFGKRIRIGEVRHGRLKLRLTKRKK